MASPPWTTPSLMGSLFMTIAGKQLIGSSRPPAQRRRPFLRVFPVISQRAFAELVRDRRHRRLRDHPPVPLPPDPHLDGDRRCLLRTDHRPKQGVPRTPLGSPTCWRPGPSVPPGWSWSSPPTACTSPHETQKVSRRPLLIAINRRIVPASAGRRRQPGNPVGQALLPCGARGGTDFTTRTL
jgi:hypothetical protein